MHYKRKKFIMAIPVLIIAVVLLISLVVKWLWNAILPSVIHVEPITYWQAVGILILSKILFGGFRRNYSPGKKTWRSGPWREKWMKMSDEERAKFRAEWKNRCGPRRYDFNRPPETPDKPGM